MEMCSAILAHFILKERLQRMGVLGCVLCIVGSTVIVLHAPEESTPTSVEEIWELATQPGMDGGFIHPCCCILLFSSLDFLMWLLQHFFYTQHLQ